MPVLFYLSLLAYLEYDSLSPGTSSPFVLFIFLLGMYLYYTYRVFLIFQL